jgi:hypothetical protein
VGAVTATLAPHHIPGYAGIPEYRPGVMICSDFGRPLWPARWDWLRHGTFTYRVRAFGPDGEELPVTISPAGPATRINWYAERKPRVNLSKYRRRQRARARRKR